MKIAVFGAGAWGTALALRASTRHDVMLWARDAVQAHDIATQRCNRRYLPGVALPAALRVTADHAQAAAHAQDGLAIVATPMSGLRAQLGGLHAAGPVVWLCKGFEAETGLLGHEVAQLLRPGGAVGALSGPSFALEVAQGRPTALVVASTDTALCEWVQALLHDEGLRVYTSADLVGVEVGGAMKNVLAIAAGILDGLAEQRPSDGPASSGTAGLPGLNARAALITRGLAEMTRLGVALGARAETFMGLSGLGDLVLTCTGALSRNRQVGLQLARGDSVAQAVQRLGHVAEGVSTAATALQRARTLGVQMPIAEAVAAVLDARITPAQAVALLMSREARSEFEP